MGTRVRWTYNCMDMTSVRAFNIQGKIGIGTFDADAAVVQNRELRKR
jgi:hypothetical protein